MQYEHYQRMYDFEEAFWWFAGMREVSQAVLRPHLSLGKRLTVADIGCGTGININWLVQLGQSRSVLGLDCSYDALQFCRKRKLRALCQGSATDLPLRSDYYDLVTSFDVVCHVPRGELSEKAFAEFYRILKPGGLLLLRLPAYQWLRSSHDDELGAPYRYSRGELVQNLTRIGFKLDRATYANTLAFPLALGARLAKKVGLGGGSDVKPLPRRLGWVERVLRLLLGLEARYLTSPRRSFPFGLSVFAVARKQPSAAVSALACRVSADAWAYD